MKPLHLWVSFLLATGCLVMAASPGFAVTHSYTEDFTTTAYRDPANTTALWDTAAGELKLPPFQVTLAGTFGTSGWAQSVTISGDYAYIAEGTVGLQVVDITDPASPMGIGNYDTPGYAYSAAIDGDYAYVADGISGVVVLNIADPANPVLAGSYDTPGYTYLVVIDGDYAYVADQESGLQVLDVTNPAIPTLAGTYDTPGWVNGVAISGDYAYVADYGHGVQVLDITNPASPTLAGSYDTPDLAIRVAISGDYAYVADWASGIVVLDVTNPAIPTLAGTYDTPGNAYSAEIDGDYAYVADYGSGIEVLDITNPASPILAGSYDTPGTAWAVAISGDYAYVADDAYGLQVMDVADRLSPVLTGNYSTPSLAWGVAVSGDYAYVADGDLGLEVTDITDPSSPVLAGSCDTPGYAYAVAISGDCACVADHGWGLQVISITNPSSPMLAGSCDTPGSARGVAISGDYAYVADYDWGLQVIDITNPSSPVLAGSYNTPAYALGVAISGDYAYVADGNPGLEVISITNPSSPVLAGNCDTPGFARGVAISGDYAYVADDMYGLQVIDITNPSSPVLAGTCDTPGSARSVAISGDYAYVAAYGSGLHLIDVTNPSSPVLAGSCGTPGGALGVAISGDCAYVADYGWGLQVIWVYQRACAIQANVGRSLAIDDSDNTILRVRMTSTQTDSIGWEVSANGGMNWMAVSRDRSWHTLGVPGTDLVWRSIHYYVDRGVNPACSDLSSDWLYSFAAIDNVADIPGDQGGWARLRFTRSAYDFADASPAIANYCIWRRIDDANLTSRIRQEGILVAEGDANAAAAIPIGLAGPGGACMALRFDQRLFIISGGEASDEALSGFPAGTWEVVGNVSPLQQDQYTAALPTLADSGQAGANYSVFCIVAHTTTPSIWYVSPPDSGYSIDNLAPAPPGGLVMTSPAALAWDESAEEDFDYFTVYGSEVPGLDSTAALIGYTSGATMDATSDVYGYYHVTATDFAGNEGEAASVENAYSGIGTPETIPAAFGLRPCRPNPFGINTSTGFDLPVGCSVSLRVFDAQGRQVRVLAGGVYPAGRHMVTWAGDDDAGRLVGSGIYFVCMKGGGFEATGKVLLAR